MLFGKSTAHRKANFAEEAKRGSQRTLKVCPLKVYGEDDHCFLDTGAALNVISNTLARKLDLGMSSAKKKIMVADGAMEICQGSVEKIPLNLAS